MVVTGLASIPSYAPGPYGVFSLASATVDRHVHTDPGGRSNIEEAWEFKADGGDLVQLELQYDRGALTRSKVETRPHSAVKPEFYRIYRIEQAADIVRSTRPVPTAHRNTCLKLLVESCRKSLMARNNWSASPHYRFIPARFLFLSP